MRRAPKRHCSIIGQRSLLGANAERAVSCFHHRSVELFRGKILKLSGVRLFEGRLEVKQKMRYVLEYG